MYILGWEWAKGWLRLLKHFAPLATKVGAAKVGHKGVKALRFMSPDTRAQYIHTQTYTHTYTVTTLTRFMHLIKTFTSAFRSFRHAAWKTFLRLH